jgi:hypothetical protein
MNRYSGNIDFVMQMEYQEGIEMINQAFIKVDEQKHWELWLAMYPNMTEKTYVPFDKFYKIDGLKKSTKEVKKKTPQEIIAMAEKIKQAEEQSRNKKSQ